jgi:arylsulfatase A-like enzyme
MEIAALRPDNAQVIDGQSLTPLFRGARHLKRDTLYWHYPMPKPHFLGRRSAAAIRRGDFKLIEFFDTGAIELYDLKTDLAEQQNLAAAMPAKAASLRRQLDNWRKRTSAEEPNRDSPPRSSPRREAP